LGGRRLRKRWQATKCQRSKRERKTIGHRILHHCRPRKGRACTTKPVGWGCLACLRASKVKLTLAHKKGCIRRCTPERQDCLKKIRRLP
jgi:hypothetical protein